MVYIPVEVSPLSTLQFGIEPDDSPQHVPTEVKAAPPFDVTFAPNVAVVDEMEVAVGDTTVGTLIALTVNPLASVPVWVFGFVTTTFQVPVAAPVIGHVPDESVVELVKVNPVQEMLLCPLIVSMTVAPDTKFIPDTEVMGADPVFIALVGLIDVTVGPPLLIVNSEGSIPDCVFGFVTTTFQAPTAAASMGHDPDESLEELVNVKPVQEISPCPAMVSLTVAPKTKFVPDTEVIDAEPVLIALVGETAVTVGALGLVAAEMSVTMLPTIYGDCGLYFCDSK